MKSRLLIVCGLLAIVVGAAALVSSSRGAGTDDLTAARFSITVDGTEIASFSELAGITSGIDPSGIEFVTDGKKTRLELPARRTPPTVTLRRGLTSSLELSQWHEAALGDLTTRKDADLVMYSTDGRPIARYHLENAWPSKLEIGGLKAGASEVLMETVTIVCERIQRNAV
jgi:phage tail-like protein